MSHVLAKLTDVRLTDVKKKLEEDATAHAEQGLYLEHLWINADHPNEVLFLFRVDDLDHCKQLMSRIHAEARKDNPHAKLPQMTFLKEEPTSAAN
jgi:hypothetical protein